MPKSASTRKQPTVAEIILASLRDVTSPMPVDALVDAVLARHESRAKNPRPAIRTKLTERIGSALVFIDRNHVLPMRVAMRGARFRVPLSQLELDEGGFAMDYLRNYVRTDRTVVLEDHIKLRDAHGAPIPTRKTVHMETHRDEVFGEYTDVQQLLHIGEWSKTHDARLGDYIIFNVIDWEEGIVQLDFEKAADARQDEIAARDKQLCDVLFDILEHDNYERIYPHVAIPTAIARLPDKSSYAGHHWRLALGMDERMVYEGMSISYPDAGPMGLMSLMDSYDYSGKPFTREQGVQVYRFSARPTNWKHKPVTVEITGNQTFFELDQLLRNAFGHDTSDHLGGFWLLMPRANGRFREVEIGACAPDPNYELDGSAADTAIAGVGLAVGSRMKYVYDFGDWIEHELVLESIESPEPKVGYPRIVT